MYWLCGIHLDKVDNTSSEDGEVKAGENLILQRETRTEIILVNASAILCLAITTFLFGFFG